MTPDPRFPADPANPFAAPLAASRIGESLVPVPSVPPAGASWSIVHDLSDRDLKRFLECDFFYDPKPFLGFVPQWVILAAIFGVIGAVLAWHNTHLGLRTGLGGVGGAAMIIELGVLASFVNRWSARRAGFTTGRRVTIDGDGVRVDYPDPPGADPKAHLAQQKRRREAAQSSRILRSAGLVEAFHPWGAFRLVEFRRDYLILWQRSRLRLVIPVRAFASFEAAEAFAQAAAGWVTEGGGRWLRAR